jgi:alkanesulfonate monooxygenase SsuD/methylene tetrahydromethanopterin reductase-like flavin-dependent oxidoreductase (luciferase family)
VSGAAYLAVLFTRPSGCSGFLKRYSEMARAPSAIVKGNRDNGPMRIGVSERSGYAVADVRVGARWMVERVRAARDAGLESLFLGEHHSTGGAYYQNVPMLGRVLAEWGDRPVGALFLLPLWHPVLLAEQVGTLASLAPGRFILQCALGGGDEQFGGMGVPLRGRVARFEWTLDVLRRLLAGEEVTTDDPLAIRAARGGPLPPEPVDVWIGASAPAAIDRAARLGDGWIAAPGLTPAEAARQIEEYRSSCALHRRPVGVTAIRRDIHVGVDPADAWRVAGPILSHGYRGLNPDSLVVGGPAEVANAFAHLADLGYSDVLVRHLADDQQEVLASYERLAAVCSDLVGGQPDPPIVT